MAWEWVGEVHEYVQRVGETLTPKDPAIKGVWLHHDATGGPGGNRTQSDAATLTRVSEHAVVNEAEVAWVN